MSVKQVEMVMAPREPHFVGDGFRVHNFIPGGYGLTMQRMDPFIMLDYGSKFHFPPSPYKPKGVGVHPHRGFETQTYVVNREINHKDSTGKAGILREGKI